MLVALGDLRLAFQFFVVVVLHADRTADVVDHILIRCRVVAARRFIAHAVRRLPIRVHIACRQRRTCLGMLIEPFAKLAAACPGGGRGTVEIERRWRRWNDVVVLDRAALAIEPRRFPEHHGALPAWGLACASFSRHGAGLPRSLACFARRLTRLRPPTRLT